MSEPTAPGGPEGQPSEEEVRAYLGQMRQAPIGQILAEVVSALLNAAQVKLGRRDARLLIDLTADLTERAAPHVDAGFADEVRRVVSQLQMGQVEAEGQLAEARAQGRDVAEENDLAGAPTGGSAPGQASSPPPSTGDAGSAPSSDSAESSGSAASRLWVPGRP